MPRNKTDKWYLTASRSSGKIAHQPCSRNLEGAAHPATPLFKAFNSLKPSNLAKAPGENGLLGMQPVFRLVEHNRLRPVDHFIGHFLTAMSG